MTHAIENHLINAARPYLTAVFAVATLWLISPSELPAQGSLQDYERASTYDQRTRDRVFRESVRPQWFGDQQDRFWYRCRTGPESHEFVLVDAKTGRRETAFDHGELCRQLQQNSRRKCEPDKLNLKALKFDDDLSSCRFQFGDQPWEFQIPDGPLRKLDSLISQNDHEGLVPLTRVTLSNRVADERTKIRFDNRLSHALEFLWVMPDGGLRSYGKVAAGASEELSTYDGHAWILKSDAGDTVAAFMASSMSPLAVIDQRTPKPEPRQRTSSRRGRSRSTSPNSAWRVAFENHNVALIDTQSGDRRMLTEDGNEQDSYGGRIWWSPDSRCFVVMRTTPGERRQISMIDSSPDNSIHSQVITMSYAKPGDRIAQSRPVLFRGDDFQPHVIDNELFANPFSINDFAWAADSGSFSFVYNQRGHQVLRLVSVDAETAQPRALIDETSETFVCYSSKKYLRRLEETNELIWMSERSGWNHLYLIDATTGAVKNAITSGSWVVRSVERVDETQRQLWLRVSGIDPQQDPYHVHLIRIDFDGTRLTRFTEGDGDHSWTYSPNENFLIDQYSRVDQPPISELRSAETGELICVLETADSSALQETGWRPPERFVAKGRDGKTDIYGIIIRPTQFDPEKKYPVLEAIYAGPHAAFVPKRFGRYRDLYEMAELGFIVVKMDGMGTSYRSKAFHDVCWKNLGDSGFPDRIAWIKAAAAERPEMDLSRVGIWGGSAGGQSAMRALIAHGDFYHAAVADCGCHDNRVDKIWWNEQWMGWPIGDHYAEQSNVTGAHRLKGDLMLIWGELDRNVDPASSMQVVDALVRADKDFEMLIMPGVGHGAAGHSYAKRRQADFFVRKLWNKNPRHRTARVEPEE